MDGQGKAKGIHNFLSSKLEQSSKGGTPLQIGRSVHQRTVKDYFPYKCEAVYITLDSY